MSQNFTEPLALLTSGAPPPPRGRKATCAFAAALGQIAGDDVAVRFEGGGPGGQGERLGGGGRKPRTIMDRNRPGALVGGQIRQGLPAVVRGVDGGLIAL